MNTVATALKCELSKIFWRPKYWILMFIFPFIGLGSGLAGSSGYSLRAITAISSSVTGPNVLFGALSMYRTFLIPLAIFMLVSDVITHEMESKSIKCILVRPISRFDVYLAMSLAVLCYIAMALGVGLVVALVWQVVAAIIVAVVAGVYAEPALPGVLGGAGPLSGQFAMVFEAIAAYALTLVPMAAFIAFAAFIAVVVRSPALVMFLCIVTYLALSFLGTFYNGFGAALFTAYISWYRMWLGERLPLRNLANTSVLLLSTIFAFFGLGYLVFDKKDI